MLTISEDKKILLSNFFSLSTLQGLNMLLPLVTLPYLVRVLGVENFGLVSFSLSIIMYFNILVSFGFELSATHEISIHRDNRKRVSEIFSAVMIIKTALGVVSLVILSILIFFIGALQDHYMLYYATFGIVIGNVAFPSWLFQGMERMRYITCINVVSRVFFTIFIFILVQNNKDYIYVPLLNSLGAILGGIYSLLLVFKLFEVRFIMPNKNTLLLQLRNSFNFFLSRVANNGSRYYSTTIIGLYFGDVVVGYYSMIEKLFYAFMSVSGVISQTIYPYMSRTKNIDFFKKIFFAVTIISTTIVIPVMYFNEILLKFVFNVQGEMLSTIFNIVFSGAVFGVVSALLGYPLLAAFGYVNYANNSLIYASLLYLVYTTVVVVFFRDIFYVVFSLPFYMILGCILRLYYINKTKIFQYDYYIHT